MDRRKTDRKRQIIEFVIEEIETSGYQNISLREIAKKQGITATALYKHFDGKDNLFKTVLIEVSQLLCEYYRAEKKEATLTSKQELILFGKFIFNMYESKPFLIEFLFFSPHVLSAYQDLTNSQNAFSLLNEYKNLVKRFVEDYSIKQNYKTIFIKLWSFLQGYSLLVVNGITIYSDELLESSLNDLISNLEV